MYSISAAQMFPLWAFEVGPLSRICSLQPCALPCAFVHPFLAPSLHCEGTFSNKYLSFFLTDGDRPL